MSDTRPSRPEPRARPEPQSRDLVVDRPELQRDPQRIIYSSLTLIAWVAWVYLWLPLVSLIGWYFGVRIFVREIVIPDARTMTMVVLTYLAVVIVLGGTLLVWSRYNVRRFRGNERREEAPPLDDADVRDWFRIEQALLERLRSADSMILHLDDDGHIEDVVDVRPLQR
ncbi:MAG: poly-beta-1,6-N-acetyl-D-glucosamine biosynthesis protein PgaD [Gemmatimonadota bacterium]|nr:poly-beta-1,6-N-acetyl-D-glucosamine biosynthesis protein PgaD [Gemmatimonadota bacterium]